MYELYHVIHTQMMICLVTTYICSYMYICIHIAYHITYSISYRLLTTYRGRPPRGHRRRGARGRPPKGPGTGGLPASPWATAAAVGPGAVRRWARGVGGEGKRWGGKLPTINYPTITESENKRKPAKNKVRLVCVTMMFHVFPNKNDTTVDTHLLVVGSRKNKRKV